MGRDGMGWDGRGGNKVKDLEDHRMTRRDKLLYTTIFAGCIVMVGVVTMIGKALGL